MRPARIAAARKAVGDDGKRQAVIRTVSRRGVRFVAEIEGAARAHAQQQEPTVESITKVVDSVVGEKLDDGQLDESALTYGDLTKVKAAIVAALIGYYHTRVPYPGFPGAPVDQKADFVIGRKAAGAPHGLHTAGTHALGRGVVEGRRHLRIGEARPRPACVERSD